MGTHRESRALCGAAHVFVLVTAVVVSGTARAAPVTTSTTARLALGSSIALREGGSLIDSLTQPLEDSQQAASDAEENVESALEEAYNNALKVLNRYRTVIVALCIPIGFLACFFGYRLLRPFLFIAGFVLGGGACFVAVSAVLGSSSAVAWASIVAMLLGGLLAGLLAMWLVKLGVFAVGACLGVVLALSLRTVLFSLSDTNPQLIFYIALAVLAILFGTLALCLERPMIIACTAFGGSFGVVYGIGHFAGHFVDFSGTNPKSLVGDPWAWAYFAGFVLLGGLGCVVQTGVWKKLSIFRSAEHSTEGDSSGRRRSRSSSRERRRRGRRSGAQGKDKYATSSHALLEQQQQQLNSGTQPMDIRIVVEGQPTRIESASAAVQDPFDPSSVMSSGRRLDPEKKPASMGRKPPPKRGGVRKKERRSKNEDPFEYAADDDESVEVFRTDRFDRFERASSSAIPASGRH